MGPGTILDGCHTCLRPFRRLGIRDDLVPELNASLLVRSSMLSPSIETWLYDAERNNWTQLEPGTTVPPGRSDASIAYDGRTHKVVLFGGLGLFDHTICPRNDTWLFDPVTRTWTNVTPLVSPSARRGQAMAYNPKDHRVVLFGGHEFRCGFGFPEDHGPRVNDTWLYDAMTNTWTDVTIREGCAKGWPRGAPCAADAPPPRSGAGLVYDPRRSEFVLFGGASAESYQGPVLGDVWGLDASTYGWAEIPSSRAPSPRSVHGMTYDGIALAPILYGGCDRSACSYDTWWYDSATRVWVQRSTTPAPDFPPGAAFSYDPTGAVVAVGISST